VRARQALVFPTLRTVYEGANVQSNIFVPAIPALASAFHRSEQDISLAVTTYLVFQAVTPSFFGSASDTFGRRPIFLLVMAIYIGANIGLALCPTSEYWLLLFLRAVQATGGSGVVSIGAGAISDVALPREKGKYMAVFQVCRRRG
jgi:MFS family permease